MLSRKAKELLPDQKASVSAELHGAIVLANTLMYLRILLVVLFLYPGMARPLLLPLLGACVIGSSMAIYIVYRKKVLNDGAVVPENLPSHPLELTTALVFALSLMIVTVVLGWVGKHFGTSGIDLMAFLVGFTDIIPFVLGLVHQSTPDQAGMVAGAIMISASSNNLAKAAYEISILGFLRSIPSVIPLLVLAILGFAYAYLAV